MNNRQYHVLIHAQMIRDAAAAHVRPPASPHGESHRSTRPQRRSVRRPRRQGSLSPLATSATALLEVMRRIVSSRGNGRSGLNSSAFAPLSPRHGVTFSYLSAVIRATSVAGHNFSFAELRSCLLKTALPFIGIIREPLHPGLHVIEDFQIHAKRDRSASMPFLGVRGSNSGSSLRNFTTPAIALRVETRYGLQPPPVMIVLSPYTTSLSLHTTLQPACRTASERSSSSSSSFGFSDNEEGSRWKPTTTRR